MIVNYTEPQLNIDQVLTVETPTFPRQSAVIVGAQYVSPGFESKFEYETFSNEGGNLELTFLDTDGRKTVDSDGLVYKLDSASVDVLVKDAEFELFDESAFDEDNGIDANPGETPTQVITTKNLRVAGNATLWSALYGRPVSIGDTVYCYNNYTGGDLLKRKVTGFIGKTIPSTHGTGSGESSIPNSDTLFAAATSNPIINSPEGYEVANIVVPGNYNSSAATVNLAGPTSVNRAVNLNGLSFISGGNTLAGVKLSLRITSYSTVTSTGNASLSSSDGIISAVVPFTNAMGSLVFDLTGSGTLHGVDEFIVPLINALINPIVGEVFSFSVATAYTPIDLASDITDGTSNFTGTQDNTFYVKVIEGSQSSGDIAQLQIYDSRGTFPVTTISVPFTDEIVTIPFGSGMQVVINNEAITDLANYPQTGFRKNDTYFINAVASKKSTTEFTGITLDGPATASGNVVSIKIRGNANGSILSNQQSNNGFELNASGISVDYFGNLTWFVAGRTVGNQYVPLVDQVGSIYLNWRAAEVPSVAEGALQINSSADLENLGPAVSGNDLSYAARVAFNRIAGNSFYVLRTAGDSAADVSEALEKIENTDLTYALAIVSEDTNSFYTAIEHAEAMSVKNVKNFRRVYFGAKCPTEFTAVSTDNEGNQAQATVTLYDGLYRYVTFTTDVQLINKEVRKGDFIEFNGNRLVVEQVVSNSELICTAASAINTVVTPAVDMVIIKPNTALNQAYFIKNIATQSDSRRGSLIWCDSPVIVDANGTPREIHPKFIAAEVAALRSITLPQLGLSRTRITSVTEAPAMYSKYKRSVLNEIAASGVMIITQESEGGDVLIRHQLTTDSSNGILYYEDSVGVNVDNLSFKIKDALDKYVGKRNITPRTLGAIQHELFLILEAASTTSIDDLDVGPQILNFSDADGNSGRVTVRQHPTFKDRIQVKVKVSIPLPMNVIEVEIEADSDITVTA